MPDIAFTLLSAFMIGFLGSTHCLGMCGGISASLSLAVPVGPSFHWRRAFFLLAFNVGRIGSYVIAAMLVAALSTDLQEHWMPLGTLLRTLAGVLLILMGLSLAGWWQGIQILERLGAPIWRRLQPLTQRFLPVRSVKSALMLGGLWGWLPCGLVYSTLGLASAQPSVGTAALLMLFFGLGTLPSMLATGYAAQSVKSIKNHRLVRSVTGTLLILFGLWTLPLINQAFMAGHGDHGHSTHAHGAGGESTGHHAPSGHIHTPSMVEPGTSGTMNHGAEPLLHEPHSHSIRSEPDHSEMHHDH